MRRGAFSILRWGSLALIIIAALLLVQQVISYSRIRAMLPPGMIIAGIPAGGLSQQQAADRLIQAYGVPVELHYGNAVIQIKPSVVGFEIDLQAMLAAADLQRRNQPFWNAFWDYLWNRLAAPSEVPLRSRISEDRLRSFLTQEVALRYDQLPSLPLPVAGTVNFDKGEPGKELDIDRAVQLIEDALRSPNSRVVNLSFNIINPPRPTIQNLEILLRQIISVSEFDGITELYLLDLQTSQEIHFAYQQGRDLKPDIAFTAASTMKIPIMVSVFRRESEPTPPDVTSLLELMIERSENDAADQLMKLVMDPNLGPLQVAADLKSLGLINTFLAGYFYPGAPLLERIKTPANLRTDTNTQPDDYNQTTPLDMAMLLDDLYQCADSGGGTFAAVFPGQISQNECRTMLTYLSRNRIGVLIQAGLPEGTQIANKHGWITENDGLLHTIGDVAIVYSPGGNYILTIFLNNRQQLVFDPANQLVANLSRAVYNYFNPSTQ